MACPYAWDQPGGVQVHVRELSERLRERGHVVVVLAPSASRVVEAGVIRVGRPLGIPYNRSTAPIDPWPWSTRAAGRALGAFRPDVVHAHEPLTPSTGMWALLAARAPVVGTFHAGPDRALLYDLAAPILRRVARRLSVRIAVSERAAEVARSRLGGTYELIPNGLDVAPFQSVAPADLGPGRKLLFVGRLHPRKGFPTAVAAFEILARDRPDLGLVVAGDGAERDAARLLGPELRSRVRMLGSVPHDRLPSIYAACDLYIGPAAGGESFGYVLLEAMAAGLPVVASDIPGYREVVHDGEEGLLVPPGDATAMADAAGRVLEDPELSERLGAAGRRRARTYDWSVLTPRIEGVYERAAGGSTGKSRAPGLP